MTQRSELINRRAFLEVAGGTLLGAREYSRSPDPRAQLLPYHAWDTAKTGRYP
ncbi:MAG TPA: hypothetical protein VE398_07975 [Acidobacteriota bacterium]|nr:hypothetical protein [Acidobacteriota bacterium]